MIAIKHLKPNVVEELLKHPDTTQVELPNNQGATPLYNACIHVALIDPDYPKEDILGRLLKAGAIIDEMADGGGGAPLSYIENL